MESEERTFTIYADNKGKLTANLTVKVDGAGDAWLTPDQVELLEREYKWARYGFNEVLTTTEPTIQHGVLPVISVEEPKSSDVSGSLILGPVLTGV